MSASISSHLLGDVLDVDRGGLQVVIADDALGLAEPADLGGDVHLEVDVVDPQRDRFAEQVAAACSSLPRQRPPSAPRRIVKTSGVCRSLRIRFRSGSRRRQSMRSSTRSTPASAAAFHSSASEECRPRPIVTQIIARFAPSRAPDASRPTTLRSAARRPARPNDLRQSTGRERGELEIAA